MEATTKGFKMDRNDQAKLENFKKELPVEENKWTYSREAVEDGPRIDYSNYTSVVVQPRVSRMTAEIQRELFEFINLAFSKYNNVIGALIKSGATYKDTAYATQFLTSMFDLQLELRVILDAVKRETADAFEQCSFEDDETRMTAEIQRELFEFVNLAFNKYNKATRALVKSGATYKDTAYASQFLTSMFGLQMELRVILDAVKRERPNE